jgi:hypothetical protein
MSGFQNQVYINPAVGLPGDFASSNPMIYKLSSTGRMVADANGVTVGHFAILNNGTNTTGTVTSLPAAAPAAAEMVGFVHRETNAQIVTYLAESSVEIYPGQPVALFTKGDFLVNVDVINGTPVNGAQVWWDTVTGNTIIGAPTSPPATTVQTSFFLVSDSATVGATVIISTQA